MRKVIFILGAALLFASCDILSSGTGRTLYLEVTPDPIDFRNMPKGNNGRIQLRLQNNVDDSLHITNLSVDNEALAIKSDTIILRRKSKPSNRTTRTISFNVNKFEGEASSANLNLMIDNIDRGSSQEILVNIRLPNKQPKTNVSQYADSLYITSNNFPVAFSPEGDRVLYYSDQGSGYNVMLADLEAEDAFAVLDDEFTNIPVGFGEDAGFIVMNSDRSGNGTFGIYQLTDEENSAPQPLLESDYNDRAVEALDSDQILFYREEDGKDSAHLLDVNSGEATHLAGNDSLSFRPVTYMDEPDRILLTITGDSTGAYSVNPDGSDLAEIAPPEEELENVFRFTPAGYNAEINRILINYNRGVYMANPDGSSFEEVISSNRNDVPISFTDSGDHILYQSNPLHTKEVFMVRRSGTGEEKITTSYHDDIPVAIGPDLQTILFETWREVIDGSRYAQVYITQY